MASLKNTEFVPTGFGTMTLTTGVGYTKLSRDEQFAVLKATIPASGVIHWNAGEFYGPPTDVNANLKLLRDYFDKYPEDRAKVCLSVKAGVEFTGGKINLDNSPEFIAKKIKLIADILGGPIDMFCLCRIDPGAKIEDTVDVIKKYVANGTLRGWSVSECNAQTFKKLHKLYPIDAVEIELSIYEREAISNGLVSALNEARVPIIAYSPLGHGFLTGNIKSNSDLEDEDHRAMFDRMTDENIKHNWAIVEQISKIAGYYGVTRSQVALEWLRWKSGSAGFPKIYAIPGTTKVARAIENLTPIPQVRNDLVQVDKFMETFKPKGYRYTKELEQLCYN